MCYSVERTIESITNLFDNVSYIKRLNRLYSGVRLKYMFYLFLLKDAMILYNWTFKILDYPCLHMDFTCLPPAHNRRVLVV